MNPPEFKLSSSERLLWSGTPRQGFLLRPSDALLIPFSLMWCGFAIFWESMVVRTNGPFFMKLWGIPFVVFGLYFVVGRFFHDVWRRSRMSYAVTSERILIATGGREVSLSLKTLQEMSLTERPDGSGTITFGPPLVGRRTYIGFGPGGMPQQASFEGIPDARTVHDLIRRAQRETSL